MISDFNATMTCRIVSLKGLERNQVERGFDLSREIGDGCELERVHPKLLGAANVRFTVIEKKYIAG